MLSVTSYSENPATTAAPQRSVNGLIHVGLLKKNLSRFWPLWAVYAVVFLLAWPVVQFINIYGYGRYSSNVEMLDRLATEMLSVSHSMGLFMAVSFGLLFAVAMFAYLCNGRALSMFHSFPIRRETLFVTNYLSGLLCFVVPLALSALLAALVQMSAGAVNWYAVGTSFLLVAGQTFFFYSFAVFCAMFTGQILAIPVFYGILNGLVAAIYFLVQAFASAFYFGYQGGSSAPWVEWLTPVYKLTDSLNISGGIWYGDGTTPLAVQGLPVLWAYMLAGVVLAVVALLIYRLRRSETAGDIVVLDWAKGLFRYGVGVCAALSLGQGLYYLLWESFFYNGRTNFVALLVCALLTGLLGYYAAEMLIHKSFRVLRLGRRGAMYLAAGLVLFGLAVNLDVLGVESRVPDASKVLQVGFYLNGYGGVDAYMSEQESVALVQEVHRAILAEKEDFLNNKDIQSNGDSENWESCYIRIEYTMEDGSDISRGYSLTYRLEGLEGNSPAMTLLNQTIKDPRILHADLEIQNLERFVGGELELYEPEANGYVSSYVSFDADQAQELYYAFQRDIDAGNVGRNQLNPLRWTEETYANSLNFAYMAKNNDDEYQENYTIRFSIHATNLLETMERLGLLTDSNGLISQAELEAWQYADDGWETTADYATMGQELPPAQPEASTAVIG